jgi:hypothetical protein
MVRETLIQHHLHSSDLTQEMLEFKNLLKGRFTLWPKVERLSISTNPIARNQSPKAVALQNAYMATLFDQG